MPNSPRIRCLGPRIAVADTRIARPPAKTADQHYRTADHRAWRAEVIRRAGGRCEAPECGRAEPRMFADHRVELRDGGAALDPDNGQCLCGSCHTRKTLAARSARSAAT